MHKGDRKKPTFKTTSFSFVTTAMPGNIKCKNTNRGGVPCLQRRFLVCHIRITSVGVVHTGQPYIYMFLCSWYASILVTWYFLLMKYYGPDYLIVNEMISIYWNRIFMWMWFRLMIFLYQTFNMRKSYIMVKRNP